ncbi:hypothetical protein CBP76_11535 [Companilactobacillus nuruki]|uniref:Uncharacterized protein n=2 Tax=Companilactobacillus nuruki TaxID=1993540 RepID=A0A2N7ARL7_9LACO|nr:hypothetical protein CBP76_11535 [Companilactobacillus nuruki]
MTLKIYVHLQKRNMDVKINQFSKEYYIIPNEFISTDQFHQIDLSKTLQDQFYLDFYVNKIEKLIKKFSIGQIKHTYHFQKLLNSYYK